MGKALLFPGQGSQRIGMGKALADESEAARAVFQEVDEALGEKLSDLMWTGDAAELTLTENAQPALMATSLAALRFLETCQGVDALWQDVRLVAGHSLGEYSALTAAGALSITDSARLLKLRGQAMQRAVPFGLGAMAALMGLDRTSVDSLIDQVKPVGICDLANDNGGGQIVVSGEKPAVEAVVDAAKAQGARRALMLDVSAPFHSRLMAPATEEMADALSRVTIMEPRVPVLANVSAGLSSEPETIRQNLVAQVAGTVRWAESMANLKAYDVTQAFELGEGRVLSGLMRRIDPAIKMSNFGAPEDFKAF